MLINRIVVSGVNKEPPPIPEIRSETLQIRPKINPYEEDLDFISGEFDSSGDQREKNLQMRPPQKIHEKIEEPAPKQSDDNVTILLNRVLINKKQLEEAISDLNGSLQTVGYELRPINK